MPIAPEQYMTISIPGTVVDTDDIGNGGTYVYDTVGNPFPPTQVQQAESRLVDGMMPLANVMVSGIRSLQHWPILESLGTLGKVS
jgi:hypothetical protein